MALWKITVKRSLTSQGLPLEEKMSIEMYSTTTSNPLNYSDMKRKIVKLFENKYCEDLSKSNNWVSDSNLKCERIS